MALLYVVGTPIGNLGDLTPRAAQVLAQADLIAAEDTRVTLKLLNHLGLKKPLVSCHEHNEQQRAEQLVERMLAQQLTVALTCDAGTPAVSDPGYRLVKRAWEAGIPVQPVCGPSAAISALSIAGFDAREFAFYGFLPRERRALRDKLEAIHASGVPVAVMYESPHRVIKLMEAVCEALPGCQAALCCDLSKLYEKTLRGPCEQVLEALRANANADKGEYCLVLDLSGLPPKRPTEQPGEDAATALMKRLLAGDTLSQAAAHAQGMGFARNEVYRARLQVQDLLASYGEEGES